MTNKVRGGNKPRDAHRVLPLHIYEGIYSKTISHYMRDQRIFSCTETTTKYVLDQNRCSRTKERNRKVTQWYKANLLNQRIFLCTQTTIKYTRLGLNQNSCSRTKE